MDKRNRILREFKILMSILEKGNNAGVRETAKELDLAPSTVHRILSILQQNGFVRKLENDKYSVGVELVRLAMLVLQHFDQKALIHQTLRRGVEATGETCVINMVTSDFSQVFVMDVAHSNHVLQYQIKVGDCHQITAGASGQAALAFFPLQLQEKIIDLGLPRYTKDTIVDRQQLLDRLKHVRKEGYAITRGEAIEGAVGIAVPIIIAQENNRVIGNVSATIPQVRFHDDMTDRIVAALKNVAQELAILLAVQFGAGGNNRIGATPWPLHNPEFDQ